MKEKLIILGLIILAIYLIVPLVMLLTFWGFCILGTIIVISLIVKAYRELL
jgi:hypothetical protein